MDGLIQFILVSILVGLVLSVWLVGVGGVLSLIHTLLAAPLRRAERARLFLNLLENALDRGQPVEESIVSAATSRDPILGTWFYLLAAWLKRGLRLGDAIARVPRLVPPAVAAMLHVGQKIGDLKKVLPACRQALRDSVSQTRGAENYLVLLAFVVTPGSALAFLLICVKVLPQLFSVAEGMGFGVPPALRLLAEYRGLVLTFQVALLLGFWGLAALYAIGPRATARVPFLDQLLFRLPWRRKRMSRDFSVMLAILLDARVPESEAIQLAAECAGNRVFQRNALQVADRLRLGMRLTDAIAALDGTGEFRWRLKNAAQVRDGFRTALAGWHNALDAKAFQQEQAAAQTVTTALVLLNGCFVGTVVIAVFGLIASILNAGLLW